jgi:hypothetical protein
MKSNIIIGQELEIGSKAFRQGYRTKTNQIVIQLPWHHFGRKPIGPNQKKEVKRKAHGLENQSVN